MTNLTLEDVERVFAKVGCTRIAQLVHELRAVPRERITLPLPIAYTTSAESGRKYLYLNNILNPEKLTAQRSNSRPTPVKTAAYLELLLASLSEEDLQVVDGRAESLEPRQFLL